MANKKIRLHGKHNYQLMALPEEIIRELFCYLSIEMLHYSLRKVCKKMEYYVDRYIDVRGTFFLVSGKNCQANEIMYIIRTPNEKFQIIWKEVSHPNQLYNLRTNMKATKRCRICPYKDQFFFTFDGTVVCAISQRPFKERNWMRVQVYRYDVLKDKWILLANNCSTYSCVNFESYTDPKSHCHPINLVEGKSNSLYDHFSFHYYPFLKLVNERMTNITTGNTNEAQFCKGFIPLKKPEELHYIKHFSALRVGPKSLLIIGGFCIPKSKKTLGRLNEIVNLVEHPNTSHSYINRYLHQVDLNQEDYTITWKSKYIAEMPYRSHPFCFKLKTNLYIAGHTPIAKFDHSLSDDERLLACTICTSKMKRADISPHIWIESESVECSCCDKYDLKEEKYYRNVCSLPSTLRNIINLKVATNTNESLAVIEFYDTVDCREKVWIFNEKEEKFEEHWDLDSDPCSQCKDNPHNRSLFCRKGNHSSHDSCKTQILRMK